MKRGSFWLKAAAAAVVVAGLGAGAALVALRVFFPEPKLRAWAVDTARRQLGREVRLDGVGLGLTGISLRGLEVSELPDFKAGTFLRVESFSLRPSWKALLKRQLVVAAVSADGLKVRVVKLADGRFNYETLASTAPAAAPAANASGAPAPELNVRRARITRGAVEYADAAAGQSWTLSDLDVDVADFGMAAPFRLTASARARGKAGARPVDAKLAFDGTLNLARGDRAAFRADVKKLTVETEGLTLTASGKAAGLDAPQVSFDAALSAAGKTLLQANGAAKLGAAADVDLKAKTPGLDTTLIAKWAPQAGVPALTLPSAELQLTGRYADGRADVKTFSIAWAGGKVAGSGSARGLGGPKPAYEGRASFGLDVPEIKPGQYPFLKLPPKLTVPAARLDGELALAGDELKISSLTAKLKAGTASVTGVVRKLGSAKPVPDVTAVLALDLPAAVPSVPPSLELPAARVDGTVRVSGEAVRLDRLTVKAKDATVTLNGAVFPQPELDAAADLNLPALTDKDLPFSGVPAGLRMPASHWTADASYSNRLIRVKAFRLQVGKNDVAASGTVTDPAGRGAFDLLIKCRSFDLGELTALTPQTRDLKLAGSGLFAFSVTGVKEKPVYAGKLQFRGLGATVAGLPLADFAGTVSLDERRVDVPNLTGKVGDGALKMDLTVKDYSRAPEIQLEASLDRFDLGRWLAAKSKVVADRQAAKAAKPASPEQKAPPISTRGRFTVGTLIHPNATVNDVKLGWDLRGVTPDLRSLDGDARLDVGGGNIRSVGDMATQSKLVKVLIFPLLIVQKLAHVLHLPGFPDFNDIALRGIVGDYLFNGGVMTLRRSEMDSSVGDVSALGTIDLPAETLALSVTAQVANVAPIDVTVSGTFDNPKSKVNYGKFVQDRAKGLLQTLQGK